MLLVQVFFECASSMQYKRNLTQPKNKYPSSPKDQRLVLFTYSSSQFTAQKEFTTPVPIIGPQFCLTYPADLAIVNKVMTIKEGSFVVKDINGNILFKVKAALLTLHDHRVLHDAARNPIVTL